MDGQRFDALTRWLVVPGSRRRLLGGLAAGALGLLGLDRAEAVVCRNPGRLCREHANCCSGLCGPRDWTGHRRCQCQTIEDCPGSDQCNSATCVDGICGTIVFVGQACDDGHACTTGETCQANGSCGGGTLVDCSQLDTQCTQGVCNLQTGGCEAQSINEGLPCDADNDAATCDTCQSGVCTATGTTCPLGDVCMADTCTCTVGGSCDNFTECANTPGCTCSTTTEGGLACAADIECNIAQSCAASAECGPGFVCGVNGCCGGPVCIAVCGAVGIATQGADTGPTIALS